MSEIPEVDIVVPVKNEEDAKHEIHYFAGESSNSFGGGSGSSAIASWVAAHFKSETVGGVTVYNLTQQK